MSTLRYCGEIRIRVTYRDWIESEEHNRNGSYRCYLTTGGQGTTIIVGAPAYLSHAVDSPEAFDAAAHAAISFADHDENWQSDVPRHAASKADGSGWHIGRSEATAWPAEQPIYGPAER